MAAVTKTFGAGDDDMWILKLDQSGTVSWQKTYGGFNTEQALSIQETGDGGYILAGYTDSFGAGSYDMWILKLINQVPSPGRKLLGRVALTILTQSSKPVMVATSSRGILTHLGREVMICGY